MGSSASCQQQTSTLSVGEFVLGQRRTKGVTVKMSALLQQPAESEGDTLLMTKLESLGNGAR